MTKTEKVNVLKARQAKLMHSEKNFKCPGVLRKVTRQIRNLEK